MHYRIFLSMPRLMEEFGKISAAESNVLPIPTGRWIERAPLTLSQPSLASQKAVAKSVSRSLFAPEADHMIEIMR